MSSHLLFTKEEGLLEYEWDGEIQADVPSVIEPDLIGTKLRINCLIAADVTLLDIFKAVERFPLLMLFMSQYSWCFALEEFHVEARLLNDDPDDNLSHLEISRYIETHTYDGASKRKYGELPPHVEDSIHFTGIGKPTAEHPHYGVSLCGVNTIAHLPVKLNPVCEIHHNYEKTGEYETWFSLLEVLDAVYDEISWHGSPSGKKEFGDSLMQQIADIESGAAKTTPFRGLFPEDEDESMELSNPADILETNAPETPQA